MQNHAMAKAKPRGRPFQKGHRKLPGAGRAPGTPNKLTRQMRELVQVATGIAGGGGDEGALEYLVACAKKNRVAFLSLLGKTIEKKVELSGEALETVRVIDHTGLKLSDPMDRKRLGPSIVGHWPGDPEET